jgi:PAS domain S-box-containing protein
MNELNAASTVKQEWPEIEAFDLQPGADGFLPAGSPALHIQNDRNTPAAPVEAPFATASGAATPGILSNTGPDPADLGFGVLFWSIRDAVVVGEAESGLIALWNPAAEALFGYPATEAVGMPLEALVPERLREAHRAGLARYAAGGSGPLLEASTAIEVPALRKGGQEIDVELTLNPLEGASVPGRFVLALIRDATARQRLERERAGLLAAAQEQARRLEELACLKADFTAMIAHELGAPVAAIRALASLLGNSQTDPSQQAAIATAIGAEAKMLATLVEDVRAASLVERDDFTIRPRPVPVASLLADAAAFARTVAPDHPLTTETQTVIRVQADPERIGQVLRNLVGNAAKHTPSGTPIAVRALPKEDRVRIEVADAGPGIHPDDLKRIFSKFGRGRDASGGGVPGVGLGLYLSRRIIRAHGSELTVVSEPGAGAVFRFTLEVAP